jgi:hypothetical protein
MWKMKRDAGIGYSGWGIMMRDIMVYAGYWYEV